MLGAGEVWNEWDVGGSASEGHTLKLVKCLLQSCCTGILCKAKNLLHWLTSCPIGAYGSLLKLWGWLYTFQKKPNSGAGGIWFFILKKSPPYPLPDLYPTAHQQANNQNQKTAKAWILWDVLRLLLGGFLPRMCVLQQNWNPNYTFAIACPFWSISQMNVYHWTPFIFSEKRKELGFVGTMYYTLF